MLLKTLRCRGVERNCGRTENVDVAPVDEIKNDVDTFFNNTNLPYTWFITPKNEKMGLYKELLEHKYRYIGYDMIVGVELNKIIRNIKTPNSLYIEEVNSKEKLEIWGELFIKSRNALLGTPAFWASIVISAKF